MKDETKERRNTWQRGTRHIRGRSMSGGIGKAEQNGEAESSEPNQKGTLRRNGKEEKGCGNEDKMRGRQPAEDSGTHQSPESHQSKQLSLLICFNGAAVNELISGKRSKYRTYDGNVAAQGHRGPPGTETHLTVLTL